MSRRIPILPTVLVALAVALMIGLGFWQLDRRAQKAAQRAQFRANLSLPETAYPANPADESYLFRTLSGHCLRVTGWRVKGGPLPDGRPGWRQIATCATGAEGPGLVVDIGTTPDPQAVPRWNGGPVRGTATTEPDATSAIARWIARLSGHAMTPPRLMIVSDKGLAGLARSARPDPADVPDNHLSYAVQWFAFAAVAVVIYALALRRRGREAGPRP